jgi:type IV secretory pathway VirB6-like protein
MGGAISFGAPPVMPYYPMPTAYARPPVSNSRISAVAGGILLLIAVSITYIVALVYIESYAVSWDEWTDERVYDWTIVTLGAYDIVAASLGLVSAICAFMLAGFPIALLGPVMLLFSGVADLFQGIVGGVIIIPLAALSVGFIAMAWPGFRSQAELRRQAGAHLVFGRAPR